MSWSVVGISKVKDTLRSLVYESKKNVEKTFTIDACMLQFSSKTSGCV
jgi:hypothetical protein